MTASILFHQFKHHLQSIKAWMQINAGLPYQEAIKTIKTLGSSQLDMYCGSLSVEEILQQVSGYLHSQGITENGQYLQWVGSGYKLCTLADGSIFTLRYIENAKPVHIHPARYAPHTVRIKANALKSIICYLLVNAKSESVNIAGVNAVRGRYLGLSPVKEGSAIGEMEKIVQLLTAAQPVIVIAEKTDGDDTRGRDYGF